MAPKRKYIRKPKPEEPEVEFLEPTPKIRKLIDLTNEPEPEPEPEPESDFIRKPDPIRREQLLPNDEPYYPPLFDNSTSFDTASFDTALFDNSASLDEIIRQSEIEYFHQQTREIQATRQLEKDAILSSFTKFGKLDPEIVSMIDTLTPLLILYVDLCLDTYTLESNSLEKFQKLCRQIRLSDSVRDTLQRIFNI